MFSEFVSADVTVPSLEKALDFYCGRLGLRQLTDIVEGRKGYLRWVTVGIGKTPVVGLLQPTGPGPLQKRVDKVGFGFHQLSFGVDDLPEAVRQLRAGGVNVVIEQADWGDNPNEAGPQTVEAFIHPRSANGVLIEFQQKENFHSYLRGR